MTRRSTRDDKTLDLLGWQPPDVSAGFRDETRVRAASLSHRISRSVSEILQDSGRPRAEIAAAMTDWLGDDVSEHMLNAYASPARETHSISLERAIALLHATGDARLLGDLLAPLGFAVIPDKYLGAIEEAMCDELMERVQQRKKLGRRRWSA